MPIELKHARFTLALFAVGVIGFLALLPFGVSRAWGPLGIVGLACLAPLLFRRPANEDAPAAAAAARTATVRAVRARAQELAGLAVYVAVVLTATITWAGYEFRGLRTIGTSILPFVVVLTVTAYFVTKAVVTLWLYRRIKSAGAIPG